MSCASSSEFPRPDEILRSLVHSVESASTYIHIVTYGVGSGVGHGKDAFAGVGKAEIYVGELLSVN